MASKADYLMGIGDAAFERLKLQGAYLEPMTRRLIREAGIGPGMRVLDIGCGGGDVSMLLAEAVGSSGHVVAIDREERTMGLASARAQQAGLDRIEFVLTTDEEFTGFAPFDAAVGRYVLFHQPDPAAMIRRAAAAVRPGGVVAFHEMVVSAEALAIPPLELWTRLARSAYGAARAGLPSPDAGGRLTPLFEDAGLPAPQVFHECLAGGPESLMIPWLIMSYQALLPIIDRKGLERADVGEMDSLQDRLVGIARATRTQFISNPEACGWVVRP